jgi:hypothetical protein
MKYMIAGASVFLAFGLSVLTESRPRSYADSGAKTNRLDFVLEGAAL